MKGLSKLADDLVRRIGPADGLAWEVLRDEIDCLTGGDLDCTQLDLLTDMVSARMPPEAA